MAILSCIDMKTNKASGYWTNYACLCPTLSHLLCHSPVTCHSFMLSWEHFSFAAWLGLTWFHMLIHHPEKKSSHPDDFTESHLFAWICRCFFLSYIFKTWWFSSWINFILHSRVVVECWVLRMLLNEISWRSWFVLDLVLERALCLNEIHGQWAEIKREHCIQHEQDVWNAICWNVLKCSSLSLSPLLSLSLFLTHTATFHTCLPHFISGTI